jgi:hypothetical protein
MGNAVPPRHSMRLIRNRLERSENGTGQRHRVSRRSLVPLSFKWRTGRRKEFIRLITTMGDHREVSHTQDPVVRASLEPPRTVNQRHGIRAAQNKGCCEGRADPIRRTDAPQVWGARSGAF